MEKNESNVPLYEKAYRIIKADITFNRLKPGDALIEKKLCEQLEISRTPLRTALQKLVSDGLATADSNKSVVVSNVTETDIQELTPVRTALETLAISMLAEKINPEAFGTLESVQEKETRFVGEEDFLSLVDTGYQFHTSLARLTGNRFLTEMIERIETVSSRYLILSGTMDRYGKIGAEEHWEILDYLKRGQYEHAALSMRDHILKSGGRILVSK